jgi:hypothetical protein
VLTAGGCVERVISQRSANIVVASGEQVKKSTAAAWPIIFITRAKGILFICEYTRKELS